MIYDTPEVSQNMRNISYMALQNQTRNDILHFHKKKHQQKPH